MSDEAIRCVISVMGIAGSIGGVFLGARLSRKTAQDLLAQQAKAKFSASFTCTLVKLHSEIPNQGEGRATTILQEDYPAHFAAYLELLAVVPKRHQAKIDEAWKHYAEKEEYELPEEREFYRFCHVLSPNKEEHQYLLAIKHINSLLNAIKT